MLGRQPLLHIHLETQAWGETGGGAGEGQGRGRGGEGSGRGGAKEDRGRQGRDRRGDKLYTYVHSYIHVAIRSIIRYCTASVGLPVANNKVVGEVELMNCTSE